MAETKSWQMMLRKEHYEKVLENVSEIPRPPYFPPLEMCSDPGLLGIRWEKWINRFDNFLDALDVQKDAVKRAMLFYYVGDEVCEIFATLPMRGGEKDYEIAKTRLSQYFAPMQDNIYEIHLFRKLTQEKGESIHQYEARLREYANRCYFDDIDKQIKSRLIFTCNMPRLRRRAQRDPSLTLQDILTIGRALELEEKQEKNKQAEELGRKSVASIQSTRSSKGEIELQDSKTKCWGKLFRSCTGNKPVEESEEESDSPASEPEEEVKVVLLEMTPQMRRQRDLKRGKSVPEGSTSGYETKDDMATTAEDKESETPVSPHRHSVDVLTVGSLSPTKPQVSKRRNKVRDTAADGTEGAKSPRKKRESRSPKKQRPQQGSKGSSPVKKMQEETRQPVEEPQKNEKENSVTDEDNNLMPAGQNLEGTPSAVTQLQEKPKSPRKKQGQSSTSSGLPVTREGSKSPKMKSKIESGPSEKESQEKPSEGKKARRRRRSKDKGEKKGILKKESPSITVTAPEESGDLGADEVGDAVGKDTKLEKGEKHEKGKVTFSEDTKEPVNGKHNPDELTGGEKNVEETLDNGPSSITQSEKGPESGTKDKKGDSPTASDIRRRRPSRDLM